MIGFEPLDGKCEDMKECADPEVCDPTEVCWTLPGGYECRPRYCEDGFESCKFNHIANNRIHSDIKTKFGKNIHFLCRLKNSDFLKRTRFSSIENIIFRFV